VRILGLLVAMGACIILPRTVTARISFSHFFQAERDE
jgi:hypothetical protein